MVAGTGRGIGAGIAAVPGIGEKGARDLIGTWGTLDALLEHAAVAESAVIGVADADRATFVGLFSALIFIVGMPLVPIWRHSRL